ncbi:TIGR04222 domain-containing protein [Nonomuraea solani]|uniref:TIGR04222 domain-containing protein n=1 Tax=Nonomuraea solani TaxID=1144553 RepID=A0A1H5W3U1_9ACTN|nr:hypothetical protein [Nonomuraea solani]SEF93998.1 TIGR04222 domain-containing protein [Nonomuraea solani]
MQRNELAYLSGGRRRVALAALAPMLIDGRLKLTHNGRLYAVTGATADDPLQEAALAQRSTLMEALDALAAHEVVVAVEADLLARRLAARRWPWSAPRPTAEGRALLEERTKERQPATIRIALDGVRGMSDDRLRRQFAGPSKEKGSLRGQGTGGWSSPDAAGGDFGGGGGSF